MSTKIFNGYRSSRNLTRTLEDFKALKPIIVNLLNEEYLQRVVKAAVTSHDAIWQVKEPNEEPIPFKDTLLNKHESFQKRVAKTGKYERDPELDLETYVCAAPQGSMTMLLLYAESKAVTEFWRKLDFINDYSYWDNSDPPENMSNRMFQRRGERWAELLDGRPPADSMYTFSFHERDLPNAHELLTLIPRACITPDAERKKTILHKKLWAAETPNIQKCPDSSISYYIDWNEKFQKVYDLGGYEKQLKSIELAPIDLRF